MTTEAPDPRTFKSWDDAFQYPIPIVRKLEAQLRSNAGENREKLRTLVGASYRDLLDTAETIIDMEVRMEQVETKLAKVGQNCNSRRLERITSNASQMEKLNTSSDVERYTLASHVAVLRSCPIVIARLMRQEGSHLLIAKVLVISRLVHKALSQSKNKPPIVDQIWNKLVALRTRLLRRIDKHLATTSGDSSILIESMCAYSLATSSTPTDVLRHFHHIRKEEIVKTVQHAEGLPKRGTDALKLCIHTCQDTQSIFPRRLADVLAKLKTQPLVQDSDVRALYELNFDVHDRWIGDEARNYTPWPRHDELQKGEAEKMLHQWSRQAIKAFLDGISASLEKAEHLKDVASLRQEVIETWIMSGPRMTGVKAANVLDDLRDTMNSRLEAIVRARTLQLQTVVMDVKTSLTQLSSNAERPAISLWSTATTSTDVSKGAQLFKTSIVNTHQGRDEAVISIVNTFDNWMDSVMEVRAIVKSMKETRWDDTFTDDVDDSDDGLDDSKQILLSEDDPRLLEEVTQEALEEALANLSKSFDHIVTQLVASDHDVPVPKSVLVLRVIRDIGDRIPRLRIQDKSTALETPFTSDLLRPLHSSLAAQIVRPAVVSYKTSLTAATNIPSKSHILWEGNPPLPAQPSPSAFRFLHGLVKHMGSHGSDLWSPNAVLVLKKQALEKAIMVWQDTINTMQNRPAKPPKSTKPTDSTDVDSGAEPQEAEAEKETDEDKPDAEELAVEKLKQLLFDVLYIYRYLGPEGNPVDADDVLAQLQKAAVVDEGGQGRLKEKASDYARKTYLLFALLA